MRAARGYSAALQLSDYRAVSHKRVVDGPLAADTDARIVAAVAATNHTLLYQVVPRGTDFTLTGRRVESAQQRNEVEGFGSMLYLERVGSATDLQAVSMTRAAALVAAPLTAPLTSLLAARSPHPR